MKKSKLLMLCLCMGLVLTGCGQKTIPTLKDGKQVVAKVDGKDFTVEDLYEELKKQGGTTVLVNLVDKFIMEQEKIDQKEAETYAKNQIKTLKAQYEAYGQSFKDALTQAGYATEKDFEEVLKLDYKKTVIAEKQIKSTFTDKEIEKYYKDNISGKMTVRYILIKPDVEDSASATEKEEAEKNALNEAKEVIAKLKDGEKFEELAKKHSDDTSTAEDGGLLSNFQEKDVVKEFWNAAKALKDGKYTTTPVKSSYGYFVILKVNEKEKEKLEDVKDEILDALYEKAKEEDSNIIAKAWVEVRKKYNLDIVDSDINKDYDKTLKELNKKTENE